MDAVLAAIIIILVVVTIIIPAIAALFGKDIE